MVLDTAAYERCHAELLTQVRWCLQKQPQACTNEAISEFVGETKPTTQQCCAACQLAVLHVSSGSRRTLHCSHHLKHSRQGQPGRRRSQTQPGRRGGRCCSAARASKHPQRPRLRPAMCRTYPGPPADIGVQKPGKQQRVALMARHCHTLPSEHNRHSAKHDTCSGVQPDNTCRAEDADVRAARHMIANVFIVNELIVNELALPGHCQKHTHPQGCQRRLHQVVDPPACPGPLCAGGLGRIWCCSGQLACACSKHVAAGKPLNLSWVHLVMLQASQLADALLRHATSTGMDKFMEIPA